MLKKIAVGATLLITAVWSLQALAANNVPQAESAFTPEFGRARPPIGFVRFCAENPGECKGGLLFTKRIAMDPDRWNLLYQVNTYVNGKIVPISDMELYGEAERWAFPIDSGDCEDYLLLKKRYLEGLNFPPSALLITVVLDEKNEGHAILTVTTDEGDFVLDNRRNEIRRWADVDYTYLKRQSPRDPRQWVSLARDSNTVASGNVAGGTEK